jgi:hypothetical protein
MWNKSVVKNESLKVALDQLAKTFKLYMRSSLTHNSGSVYTLNDAMIRQGVSLFEEKVLLHIPYGMKRKDFMDDIDKYLVDIVYPELQIHALRLDKNLSYLHDDDAIVGMVLKRETATYISVIVYGHQDLSSAVIAHLNNGFVDKVPAIVDRVTLNDSGRLTSNDVTLPDIVAKGDIRLLYPNFDFTPAELWEEFRTSSSNVILLIGPPGLGKSSFIRAMLDARGWGDGRTFVVDNTHALTNHGLADYIRLAPRNSVFVTEDSDTMVAKREDGNNNMAALLNATSGIIPTDTKIIISTNLPNLRRVDEALLRPGRMFRVLEFKPLTIEQGHRVRETLELPAVNFGSLNNLTLAEAINWHELASGVNKAEPVGFV